MIVPVGNIVTENQPDTSCLHLRNSQPVVIPQLGHQSVTDFRPGLVLFQELCDVLLAHRAVVQTTELPKLRVRYIVAFASMIIGIVENSKRWQELSPRRG